jgi:hypothetical protein
VALDRELARPLLIVLAVGLVVLGLIWATGGFRPAQAVGRPTAPGEAVDLERWTITVQACEYVDRDVTGEYEADPAARVAVRILNRTGRTIQVPSDGILTARLGAEDLSEARWAPGQVRSELNFDPDVAVTAAYDFAPAAGADLGRDPTTAELSVDIHRERDRANFVLTDNWVAEEPAATVTMSCPDRRRGSL